MDSSTEEVGLILPVFLRILPDMLCDEWPPNLLTRLKYTLCVIWSKNKNWNFNCRSCAVIRPTLPLELASQPEWWQISVVMSARNTVFLKILPIFYVHFNFINVLWFSYYMRLRQFVSIVYSSPSIKFPTHPSPLRIPNPCWRLLRSKTNFHSPCSSVSNQLRVFLLPGWELIHASVWSKVWREREGF